MALYSYRGRNAIGELVSGRFEGDSIDAVATRLFSLGITPLEIHAATESDPVTVAELWRRMGGGRPSTKDLVMFCRQMHTITRSGLPLLQGIGSLAQSTHNAVLRDALEQVIVSLETGRGLAASLERHPDIFPPLFVSIIRVGESTGTLDTAFERMTQYLALDQQIRDRVKSAVRYPLIVLGAITFAIGIVTVYVIPAFQPIFRRLGDDIPLPTRIIMTASHVVTHYWPWLLIGAALVAGGIIAWLRTPAGRLRWDRWRLHLPVLGRIATNAVMARVCRSLSVALAAGLPINQTLRTIAMATGNTWMSKRIATLRDGIERGESLSRTAGNAKLFTPLIMQMIVVGESTGSLPELLGDAADFYEREVEYDLENLSAAIEPILIVAVGVCVLVLALGVFLPMWDMVSKARGG